MQDAQLDGMYRMASKFLGYTGPRTREALENFRRSNPAVAAKMQRYSAAMAKGGLMLRTVDLQSYLFFFDSNLQVLNQLRLAQDRYPLLYH